MPSPRTYCASSSSGPRAPLSSAAAASISAPAAVAAATVLQPPTRRRRRAHGGGLARRPAPGDARAAAGPGGRRSRRRTIHTDRDVGAASIGAGLLAAYAVTGDPRYLRAATGGGRLPARRRRAGGRRAALAGLGRSGRAPFGHAFHELRRRRGRDQRLPLEVVRASHSDSRFRTAALAGMRWLVAQAEGRSCPQTACSWRWTDDPSWRVAYYGVGMGQAGIVLALDTFADRTGDASFRAYARAGAARLRALTANGTRPLPRSSDESARHETGFLSGSAGAAYVFLERYRHDHDPVDLATATPAARVGGRPGGRRTSAGTVSWPFAGAASRLDCLGLRARSRRDRLGEPAGLPCHRRPRLPRARATAGSLAAARRRPRRASGTSCPATPASPGSRRARQRRRGDRLGARGPRPRGHRHGRERRSRADGARRAPPRGTRTTGTERSGTRAGPTQADGCAPSRPGTGAPPGSPRSRLGWPAGPA